MYINTTGCNSCGILSIGHFDDIQTNMDWRGPSKKLYDFKIWYSDEVYSINQTPERFKVECLAEAMALLLNHPDDDYQCVLDYYDPDDEDEPEFTSFHPSSKTIIATLSEPQRMVRDGYWHEELTKYGFEMVRTFGNVNGETNYFYMRIPIKENDW